MSYAKTTTTAKAQPSSERVTIGGLASLYPDERVVIRYNEPQPAIEAMRLRPVGRYAPASIISSMTAMMTVRSRCLPTSHRANHALTDRNHHQPPRANRISQTPRHPFSRARILKTP